MENKFIEQEIREGEIKAPVIYNKNPLGPVNTISDPVYLITQFYISKNSTRNSEILHCLKENVKLGLFTKIFLINERPYTAAELQLGSAEMECIEQIIYDGARMTYVHPCRLIADKSLRGYIVIANSDIFFDSTLKNLGRTCLAIQKSIYALLRFEYNREKRLGFCKLFGPRVDSQDTWIFHTNFTPDETLISKLNFMLGTPGCDNALVYHFYSAGYMIYNEPYNVKTYHYHTSKFRNYTRTDAIPRPYVCVKPVTTF